MDNTAKRNFILFTLLLVSCSSVLIFSVVKGDKSLAKTDDLVIETQEVITQSERVSSLIEGMLSAQRGYLITGNEEFVEEYENKKAEVSERIASLSELIAENPSQMSRLAELRDYFTEFSKKLEERANVFEPVIENEILFDVQSLDNLKNNIMRINNMMLKETYEKLNSRFQLLGEKKKQYLKTLLFSVGVGTILLLIFNGYLLFVQRSKGHIAASLKEAEERLSIAIDGSDDGIFDWDIKNNVVFFSRQFFEMIGEKFDPAVSSINFLKQRIHEDDLEKAWSYIEQYLDGGLSEYRQSFRMKHESGRWVWVQSRGKALFGADNKATRIVCIHTDITHTVKAQERLKAEKIEAEDANRAKSEFLAHMSHEIRTPLTAINGIVEIFERTKDSFNEKQQSLVGTLKSSTSSLIDLINDILDFSKIESGELELDEHGFSLDEVFENVISMMALKASEKGISFVFDYSALKGQDFYGDVKRIRQILVNLINNAIKFTDDGGVKINAELEDREGNPFLRINVSDTGIGIDSEDFDLVFQRFKQADSSVSRKYGGTGLGLPISKNLANLMGGDIFLSSQPGKGSTFSLLLPVKIEVQSVKTEKQDKGALKINDKIRSALSDDNKILVVEDYEGNVVLLSYMFDELDVVYDVARNGADAVDMWKKNHYDVVLMDIQMPVMDGFSATKHIRDFEAANNIERTPIIGMTAHALVGDKDKCIESGMDSYLPKPLVEADLKREILKYVKAKKAA
ncbi:MAG: ATP-binding protein [Alphaproteobacteria bacterium]|nr:ATP-binding protein [Alphaproteobacteria bacterium]